jgi:hypothetical protein
LEFHDLKSKDKPFITDKYLANKMEEYYPFGISRHGHQYLLKGNNPNSSKIEIIFELIRICKFPELPSRFVSMFAWGSVLEAVAFKNKYRSKHPHAKVFRVDVDERFIFKGDMNLLRASSSNIEMVSLAEKYWSGGRSANPQIEVLIPLPQTVVPLFYS